MNDRPKIEIVDREMAEVLRGKTERERLEISWGMWRSARRILRGLIASEHRDWSDSRIETEVSRRLANGGW